MDESGKVVVRSNREIIDDAACQTLSPAEIDELKRKGTGAGKELIAKLLLSHTAIEQKTAYSLAKYKLLKTKKYIRRFTVLPLDVSLLGKWMLEDRDASKVMELRHEAIALLGCWADVHFASPPLEGQSGPIGGRWLAVDDTAGLLVAAMAERMGILYAEPPTEEPAPDNTQESINGASANGQESKPDDAVDHRPKNPRKRPRRDDFEVHYAPNNTITVIHSNNQPSLQLLRYFDYDATDPDPTYPYHPLFTNLLPISWLQLLSPEDDPSYADKPGDFSAEEIASWKTNRRGNFHRKRRRWARTRHVVDGTRAGGFAGLAVASTMEPISVLRHTLPLLDGGAPIAIYSPNVEPLMQLIDCFSVSRRAAWVSSPPPQIEGKTAAELEHWEGTPEFPLNPALVLGASLQTSRARRWQVLDGRTHPFMTSKGGAEGYIFTGWRARPVDGRVEARGKFGKKRAETSSKDAKDVVDV